MPEWLFARSTVIAFAIAGGVISLLASWCQSRGKRTEQQLKRLNQLAYTCMAVSIILFIGAGFFGMGGRDT